MVGARWRWIAAIGAFAGLGLVACSGATDVTNVPAATEPEVTTPATGLDSVAPIASGVPASEASWTASEVIDGDTFRVVGPGGEQTVRMIGINTPERGECFYDEAAAALRFSLGDRPLRLVEDVSEVDQYGRLLRYVELEDGTDVGAELVRAGYARSHHYEPDVGRNDEYDELQAVAQQSGAGLWAPDACGTPVASDASISIDGQFDAPGDDNFNLNEEWVRFTNSGGAPVDLSGWEVADESSSHRYTFEELTLAPGSSVTLHTGCGTDSEKERYWCNKDSAVWNNSGDTVFLRDASGNNVVSETYREQ